MPRKANRPEDLKLYKEEPQNWVSLSQAAKISGINKGALSILTRTEEVRNITAQIEIPVVLVNLPELRKRKKVILVAKRGTGNLLPCVKI